MANSYDISIEQGASLNLSLVASDSSGSPLNLSGYQAKGAIKYSYGSTGALVSLNPVIDPSYVSGIVNISLTPAQTSGLPITKAVYGIGIFLPSGNAVTILEGYASISPTANY
jgi:hypothetical protein